MPDPIGSGAAALAGNPGNPPPADGGAPPPAGGVPGGAPPPAAGGDWLSGLGVADPEISSWATSKGWKSPADALVSHRNLERLLGSEKVPVPKDPNDAEGWDRFYKAAGRPDTADAYGLDKLEGADPAFAKGAAEMFHKNGLSATQAQALTGWYGEQAKAAAEAADTAFVQQSQVEWADLQKEWGPAFDAKLEAARRATNQFGIDEASRDKLERAMGTKGMMSLLTKIGQGLMESRGIGFEKRGDGDGFLSPAEAQEQINLLMKDPDFTRAVYDGKAAEKQRLDRLQRIAVGV